MQVTVTFDPAEDESEAVALQVAYAYGLESVEDLTNGLSDDETSEVEVPVATAANPKGWSPAKMRRYVTALKPTARTVLRAIADGAPEASLEDVQKASGLEAYQYAGSMSSFGFAARNTRGVKEKPFVKADKAYVMDEAVAQIAIEALDHLGF